MREHRKPEGPPQRTHETMANRPNDVTAPPSSSQTKASKDAAAGAQRWRLQPWWPIFLVIMLANYVATQVFFREPSSIAIPYSFFKQQVEAGNVEDVTSVGDSIQGHFKTTVTYPLEQSPAPTASATASPPADRSNARTSMQFRTQRPTFADQDLERRLEEKGVAIQAADESGSSCSSCSSALARPCCSSPRLYGSVAVRLRQPVAGCSASGAATPSGTARSSQRSRSMTSRASTRPRTS